MRVFQTWLELIELMCDVVLAARFIRSVTLIFLLLSASIGAVIIGVADENGTVLIVAAISAGTTTLSALLSLRFVLRQTFDSIELLRGPEVDQEEDSPSTSVQLAKSRLEVTSTEPRFRGGWRTDRRRSTRHLLWPLGP